MMDPTADPTAIPVGISGRRRSSRVLRGAEQTFREGARAIAVFVEGPSTHYVLVTTVSCAQSSASNERNWDVEVLDDAGYKGRRYTVKESNLKPEG